MARYLGNAFSLGMLDCLTGETPVSVECTAMTLDEARAYVQRNRPTSTVGHLDTAELYSAMLGDTVEMRRVSTSLLDGDEILVGQYNGPRLPEGARTLPEGAKVRWILARIVAR